MAEKRYFIKAVLELDGVWGTPEEFAALTEKEIVDMVSENKPLFVEKAVMSVHVLNCFKPHPEMCCKCKFMKEDVFEIDDYTGCYGLRDDPMCELLSGEPKFTALREEYDELKEKLKVAEKENERIWRLEEAPESFVWCEGTKMRIPDEDYEGDKCPDFRYFREDIVEKRERALVNGLKNVDKFLEYIGWPPNSSARNIIKAVLDGAGEASLRPPPTPSPSGGMPLTESEDKKQNKGGGR